MTVTGSRNGLSRPPSTGGSVVGRNVVEDR